MKTSVLVVIAAYCIGAMAQPVVDSFAPSDPKCKGDTSNAIKIRSDLRSDAFQSKYYVDSTIFVSDAEDLYLDYVQFEQPCGVTTCNYEYTGLGRRDLTQIMSPQGKSCALAHESISTFRCQGGQGTVQVHVDKDGKAAFSADHPVAYWGSWKKNGCVTAARKGKSSGLKDFLIVDCSGKFETTCVDEPVTHG